MDDIFSAILDVGREMLSDAVLALNAKTDRDDVIPRTRGDNPGRWQWCSRRKPYRPLLGSPVKEKK